MNNKLEIVLNIVLYIVLNIVLSVLSIILYSFTYLTSKFEKIFKKHDKDYKEHEDKLNNCILILMSEVMKADKKNMHCELDVVKEIICQLYKNDEERQKKALKQFQQLLTSNHVKAEKQILDTCDKINLYIAYGDGKKIIPDEKKYKRELIQNLLKIAYSDEELLNIENSLIHKIAELLQFDMNEYSDIVMDFELRNSLNYDTESLFKYSILVLLAEISKADKKIYKNKLDNVKNTIRRYYKTEEEQAIALKKFMFIVYSANQYTPQANYDFLKANMNDVAKTELIMELLAVAYADDCLYINERKILNKIAENLGIGYYEFKRIQSIFQKKYQQNSYKEKESQSSKSDGNNQEKKQKEKKEYKNGQSNTNNQSNTNDKKSHYQQKGWMSGKEAYDILGVDMSVSDAEIKKAYRAMAIKYHPDNAAKLGEEAIRQATETMKQINAAWETVKMARRMK